MTRYRTQAERDRAHEAAAKKRITAKREERETHAQHMMDKVLDMWGETAPGNWNRYVSHNPRTGRYTVHIGAKATTYCEKSLTEWIASEYARHHEAELQAGIPEDDK